jgi:hypothetical protein
VTPGEVIGRIADLLARAGIEYMLTGSFASSYHGAPRATQDIDVVIAATPEQLRSFAELLPASEYYLDVKAALRAQEREGLFNVIDRSSGWKIDFIFRRSRPFSRTEFDRRSRVRVGEMTLFIASAEDVLIAKLEWAKRGGSERQIEDVAGILRIRSKDLDGPYVQRWIQELGLESQWSAANRAAGRSS